MSPYKTFLNNTRQYFNTNGFLRFLLSMYIVVFAVGGALFVLGTFLIPGIFFNEFCISIGTVLMLAGLLLTAIKEDMMTLVIASAAISFLCLISWILALVGVTGWAGVFNSAMGQLGDMFGGDYSNIGGGGGFSFTSFFYFLAFGTLTTLVFLKAEKFQQMRAASAARAQMAGIACPRCGGFIPMNAAFCPSCGAQNPAMQQYAAPMQSQYAPPAQPQYAPPAPPQYTAPAQPQYAPPVQQQDTPPAPPAEPEATPTVQCVYCSAYIPAGASFCSKCGTKQ